MNTKTQSLTQQDKPRKTHKQTTPHHHVFCLSSSSYLLETNIYVQRTKIFKYFSQAILKAGFFFPFLSSSQITKVPLTGAALSLSHLPSFTFPCPLFIHQHSFRSKKGELPLPDFLTENFLKVALKKKYSYYSPLTLETLHSELGWPGKLANHFYLSLSFLQSISNS